MGADLGESRRARSVEIRDQDDVPVRERWNGEHDDLEGNESDEPRDSGKHRSKDKGKSSGRREEKDRRSRDRERSREREKDHKDSEKDRRDRRKENRDERDKDKDKIRDRVRERDADREKHREKEKDKERKDRGKEKEQEKEREREKEFEKDDERGHSKERGKEKSRDKDKDREKERPKDRDREKHKDREREKEKDRSKEAAEREKGKDRSREKEKQADLEKDKGRDRERSTHRQKDETHDRDKDTENDNSRIDTEKIKHLEKTDETVLGSRLGLASDLGERISKMREERLKQSSEGASEVLSWVNRSRKIEEKRNAEKEKALQLSRIFEEQDNMDDGESDDEATAQQATHHLGGVKVLHGIDKVLEGGAVVLTLKDQSILAEGDINQEVDMLENVEIGEQKRRDEAFKAAKKKPGVYDDKFNDEPGSERKILPQYDDPIVDEGVTLDSSGRLTSEAEKKLEELRKRIKGVSASNNAFDLTSTGKILSDYYTQEEMTKFKKPKKKKSLRKKEKLDLRALEAEAKSAGLGAGDLGSRKDGKRANIRKEQDKIEAEMRSNAYEAAIAKADEASKALRQEQVHAMQTEEDDNPAFGDDDDELRKSLERARKIALKKQTEGTKPVPQLITQLATATANESNSNNQDLTSGDQQENKVVFTEMEEFVWGLQLDEEEKKPESEDVFMEEDREPSTSDQEMEDADDAGWAKVQETSKDDTPAKEEEEEVAPDETIHEHAVGKGLAGALKLLKGRGTLKETIEWGGRNMDKKKSKLVGIYDGEGSKEIRIERTDEYGRILTPKEAFRLLSHKFHGKGPGKMKQEKRMRQYEEQMKIKQMKNADTPSLSVERMREVQAKQQTPYLVLSGHVKPGQSSDPRSGFATVEKDLAGGLTPMLGDKKVEHFLNIKRKPEPGDGTSQKKPRT